MRTPFLGQFYKSRSKNLDTQRAVNLYLELAESKQGKQKGMLLMTPGLDPLVNLTGTAPPPPPPPPPVGSPVLFAVCNSCHVAGFSLDMTFTGNVYAQLDLEGSLTKLTEPISINSANSFTGGGILDSSGNLYCVNFYEDDAPGTTVTVYPLNSTRNTVPTSTLGGTLTTLPNAARVKSKPVANGGICLGTGNKIYLAVDQKLYQFAAGASGNTAPLASVDISTLGTPQSCRFDPINKYIWIGFSVDNNIAAYDETLTQQRLITGAGTGLNNPTGVWLDSAGLIYVANQYLASPSVTVYAANANGNATPVQTIAGAATTLSAPVAGIVGSDGTIYVTDNGAGPGTGNLTGATYTSAILSWPAGTTGNIAPTNTVTGAKAHIDHMNDGTGSAPTGLLIGPTSILTTPFHPPATKFTNANFTTAGFSGLPATGRYGLLACWSFSITFSSFNIFENTGLAGLTFGNAALQLFDGSGNTILRAVEGTSRNECWFLDVISWDTVTQTVQWFVGGTASANLTPTWSSSNLVSYPNTDAWQIGQTGITTLGLSTFMLYIGNSFFDLTVSANQATLFANPDTMTSIPYCYPISWGTAGASVLGTSAHVFFDGAGTPYMTNQGTAGGSPFTLTGSLADAMNTP